MKNILNVKNNTSSCAGTGLRTENVTFSKNKKQIKAIYHAAFPKNERMPFGLMIFLTFLLTTKFFAFYDGSTLCGMIYMSKLGGQAFIMFFAVDEKLRSKGYGSKILAEVRTRYPKSNIAVSIEKCDESAPDFELRKRRKAFYLRNGYSDSGYDIKLNGILQEVLSSGGFNRVRFSLFLIVYSCFAILPMIRKREKTE